MQVFYIVSNTEENARDSVLDVASVALPTVEEANAYANVHGGEVFRVTIEAVK